MNLLLTSVGRRSYLVSYFKEALHGEGQVHVANSQQSPAFFAADRSVVTPLIYDQSYIPFLLDYCKKNTIELLLSLFDIDLPVLSAHQEEFAAIGTTLVIADEKVINICNDKWETYQFLISHGFSAPKTYLSLKGALKAVDDGELSYPVMIKPRWGMGSLAIYEADNVQELEVLYKKSEKAILNSYLQYEAGQDRSACIMIQERLQGKEFGLDVINDLEGNYQVTVQKQKFAMRSGETDCAETVSAEELEAIGAKISRLFRHKGNLDMDVFQSGGQFYVLEMNARFGGGYPFSHMAGINLPQAIVDWKLGKTVNRDLLKVQIGVRSHKDIRMIRMEKSNEQR